MMKWLGRVIVLVVAGFVLLAAAVTVREPGKCCGAWTLS
jgi:hypothetical protein